MVEMATPSSTVMPPQVAPLIRNTSAALSAAPARTVTLLVLDTKVA